MLQHWIFVVGLVVCSWEKEPKDVDSIKIYEYGKLSNQTSLVFVYTGTIPAFMTNYTLKMEEEQYSYIRVHYWNTISTVDINYDNRTSTLYFYIKYPFMEFPFGIEGYTKEDTL